MIGGELMRMWMAFTPDAAQHADELAAGGAADDRIIDETMLLPLKASRTALYLMRAPKSRMDWLGLNKGAADVVAADQAQAIGNAGLFRIADRGHIRRIRNRHHHIRFGRSFARQLPAQFRAHLIHAFAEEHAVRPRKINIFKTAVRRLRALRKNRGFDSPAVHIHQFARLNFADELGAEQIERAGFRRDNHRLAQAFPAPAAERRKDRARRSVLFSCRRRANRSLPPGAALRGSHRAASWLWNGRRDAGCIRVSEVVWKMDPGIFQILAERQRVGQIAVVRDGRACRARCWPEAAGRCASVVSPAVE